MILTAAGLLQVRGRKVKTAEEGSILKHILFAIVPRTTVIIAMVPVSAWVRTAAHWFEMNSPVLKSLMTA